MAEAFIAAISIPDPDINLEIGIVTQAEQLGTTMFAFYKILLAQCLNKSSLKMWPKGIASLVNYSTTYTRLVLTLHSRRILMT